MQSSSRRAFLRGRRLPRTEWEAFCQRMAHVVSGHFHVLSSEDGACVARLIPGVAGDVRHARAMCAQYGISMRLEGTLHEPGNGKPQLWVAPGMEVGACERIDSDSPQWFVQPGCTLGQLVQCELPGFAAMPHDMSVASWLADRSMCDWPTGQTLRSGITHMSVLLGDGNAVVLGPFGAEESQPLSSATRQLVSTLFQLCTSPQVQACRKQTQWPGRFRLDALMPQDPQSINLSHLLLGHGGQLGWIEWVVLDERLLGRQYDVSRSGREWRAPMDAGLAEQASALDHQIKCLFDPQGVFPGNLTINSVA